MSRLTIPDRDDVPEALETDPRCRPQTARRRPDMFRLIATSPAVLQGFAANNGALTKALRRQDA